MRLPLGRRGCTSLAVAGHGVLADVANRWYAVLELVPGCGRQAAIGRLPSRVMTCALHELRLAGSGGLTDHHRLEESEVGVAGQHRDAAGGAIVFAHDQVEHVGDEPRLGQGEGGPVVREVVECQGQMLDHPIARSLSSSTGGGTGSSGTFAVLIRLREVVPCPAIRLRLTSSCRRRADTTGGCVAGRPRCGVSRQARADPQ